MHALLLLVAALGYIGIPAKASAAPPVVYWPFNGPLTTARPERVIDFHGHLPPSRRARPAPLWEPAAHERLESREANLPATSCWGGGTGEVVMPVCTAPAWSLRLPAPAAPPPAPLFFLFTRACRLADVLVTVEELRQGSLTFEHGAGSDAYLRPEDVNDNAVRWEARLLLDSRSDVDERLRVDAVRRLALLPLCRVADVLVESLEHDPEPSVREAAAHALGSLRARYALLALRQTAGADSDLDVRRAAELSAALIERCTLSMPSHFLLGPTPSQLLE